MNTTKTTPSEIHWKPCGMCIQSSTVTTTMIAGIQSTPNASLQARSVERYRRNGASAGPSRSPGPARALASSCVPHPA